MDSPQLSRPVSDLIVSPNDPPWSGWVAFAVWLMSVMFIVVVPSVFLLPYVVTKGIDLQDRQRLLEFAFTDPTAIILQLAPIILSHVLTLALCWLVVTKFNRYSFRETLGWKMNGFKIWHAGVITIVFYAIAVALTQAFGDVENEFDKLIAGSRTAVYLVAFMATFTAPLVEEVVYRGLLYSAFQRTFGFTVAVILVTLMFTIVHVPQYSQQNVPDYASLITLLLLSLALTLLRAATGSLLPSIVLHTVFNGVQSVVLLLEPFIKTSAPTPDPTGLLLNIFK
jgi:membrane protease YdiL (CAAX protease family)